MFVERVDRQPFHYQELCPRTSFIFLRPIFGCVWSHQLFRRSVGRESNARHFNHESGAVTTELSPLSLCATDSQNLRWPIGLLRKNLPLGPQVKEVSRTSRVAQNQEALSVQGANRVREKSRWSSFRLALIKVSSDN